MSNEISVTRELSEFLDNCPLDGFIDKLSKNELSKDDLKDIGHTLSNIKFQESKLRALRQRIEYQVRKH